jgi:hypothetical protein
VRTELLAVIADRTGVAASSQQYREPPKPVKRPEWITGDGVPQQQAGNAFSRAMGTLAASAKRVMR